MIGWRSTTILAICWACGIEAAAQVMVVNGTTLEPLPFAHLRSLDGTHGAVSNDSGLLTALPNEPSDTRWVLSYIGFESDTLEWRQIAESDTLKLQPSALFDEESPYVLEEVMVMPQTPLEYMQLVRRRFAANYHAEPHQSRGYYREQSYENGELLNQIEAITINEVKGYEPFRKVTSIPPDSVRPLDSMHYRVYVAGVRRIDDPPQPQFMTKEREKATQKGERKADRKDEDFDPEEYAVPTHLVSPTALLGMDPVRHVDTISEMSKYEVGVFDQANEGDYDFHYGTPVKDGEQWLVVLHFDQRDGVKRSMLNGTMWIDQDSKALVRIDMGLSPKGLKYLVPGYVDAALWVYGLSYQLLDSQLSYEYTRVGKHYQLKRAAGMARFNLEKRRLFSENDKGSFRYSCHMDLVPSNDSTQDFPMLGPELHLTDIPTKATNSTWRDWLTAP